jgi:glycine/D-amino acid oxidase-like deaminating enzyme
VTDDDWVNILDVEIALEGTDGEEKIHQYRKVLADNGHPYETWDNAQLAERYPQWHLPAPALVTYQEEMGFVDIAKAGQTHRALASALGVTFRDNTAATRLETRNVATAPNRLRMPSPRKRIKAMDAENPAKPRPAIAMSAPSSCSR